MYYYHNPYMSPFHYNAINYPPAPMSQKWPRKTNSFKARFSKEEAAAIALLLGIDFAKSRFDLEEFWNGVNVELEHGKKSSQTNVTGDDPLLTGKIAWAHLNEFPDYYQRLKVLEDEAKTYWSKR